MAMTPEEQKEFDAIKAERDSYKKLADDATKPPPSAPPPPPVDEDLREKVRRENEDKAKKDGDHKRLEASLRFNLMSDKFIKEHESILPKEIGDIFAAADKESYDSAIEKANATKAAIIQSFFSLQANVDQLTSSHKSAVEDYLKLTKKGREERAHDVYENIFEPSLEMTKRIKRAEQISLGRNGEKNESDKEKEYKDKLVSASKKHYFGEK